MAVLKRKRDGSYYVVGPAWPNRQMCTWQVSPAGLARLRSEGIGEYQSIPIPLFIELQTNGLIYTGGSGPGPVVDVDPQTALPLRGLPLTFSKPDLSAGSSNVPPPPIITPLPPINQIEASPPGDPISGRRVQHTPVSARRKKPRRPARFFQPGVAGIRTANYDSASPPAPGFDGIRVGDSTEQPSTSDVVQIWSPPARSFTSPPGGSDRDREYLHLTPEPVGAPHRPMPRAGTKEMCRILGSVLVGAGALGTILSWFGIEFLLGAFSVQGDYNWTRFTAGVILLIVGSLPGAGYVARRAANWIAVMSLLLGLLHLCGGITGTHSEPPHGFTTLDGFVDMLIGYILLVAARADVSVPMTSATEERPTA